MLKFNKGTLIALYAMMELAQGDEEPVSAAEIAEHYHVSAHHLAKVLQQLVKRGLVHTTRGAKGGHRLAKDAKDITLHDIVEIFEGPPRNPEACLLQETGDECDRSIACRLRNVVEEMDEQVRATLQSISLKTLVKPM
ncbi:MAG: RrF2 family transcriptional regulator [Planctomycetota bacterium]